MSAATDVPRLLGELGFFLTKHGLLREANVMSRGLAELRPEAEATHLLRGTLCFAAGKYADAEKQYRELLQRQPDSTIAHAFLGEALVAQRRTREAEDALAKAARGGDEPAAQMARELQEGLRQGLFRAQAM
jgi:tetratricopeptide (TPR) repeat protein